MPITNKIDLKVAEVSEYLDLNKSGEPRIPVNLNPILKKYGLLAYEVSFTRQEVCGAFDRSAKTIFINSTDPQTKKMFTLAHELGHYFLHSSIERDVLYREKSSNSKKEKIESEADLFASKLLMPEATIRSYWTVAESIQQMADLFGVSYTAMLNRLRSLEFI